MDTRSYGDTFPTVEIMSDGPLGVGAKVTVDGVEAKNLRSVHLSMAVDDVTRLELEHIALRAHVRAQAAVDHTHQVELFGPGGRIGSGSGSSIAAALRDLAEQLDPPPAT
jgi:hypothetical protein